jgi:glycosyltransferase involved in cell wall biosynthesis
MNVWVTVPAYNEGPRIVSLLESLKKKKIPVVVVDDGSADDTYAQAMSVHAGVVLKNEHNAGKGAALKKAFGYLIDTNAPCDAVVIMDADNQHSPDELDAFIKKLEEGSKFVQGNRMGKPDGMPTIRLLTNRFMSWLVSRMCRQSIPDTQCGYKGIHIDVLHTVTLKSNKYEIDSELLIRAARAGYMIDSVGVSSIYRQEKSSIRPVIDTLRFVRFLVSLNADR